MASIPQLAQGSNSTALSPVGSPAPSSSSFWSQSAQAIQDTANALNPQPNYRGMEGLNNRDAEVITWRLPNGSSVQMYINPQSLTVNESKQINYNRTKGGFVVQYWGANLTQLDIRGTTGSASIQGINVLHDIYMAENRAFELVAASQIGEMTNTLSSQSLNSNSISTSLADLAKQLRNRNFILRPSLAALATSILMFYQGIEYKGFFTAFSVTESADRAGLFDYTMTFMSTEQRGKRQNYLAWSKEPLANDLAGSLINGIGNSIRQAIGLSQQAPQNFHPDSAPLTFAAPSSDIAADLGFTSTEQQSILTKGTLT